ncbi:hypothetical protein COCCADRAFT_88411, partial [Bipolaris zeicola 26-R-13]
CTSHEPHCRSCWVSEVTSECLRGINKSGVVHPQKLYGYVHSSNLAKVTERSGTSKYHNKCLYFCCLCSTAGYDIL